MIYGTLDTNAIKYRSFNEILVAFQRLHQQFVHPVDSNFITPPRVLEPKYYAFRDAVGALDGSHVSAYISPSKQAPYRNRKKGITQNVLAACSFDLLYQFVMPGWEGSAHDSRVLNDAITKGFSVPPGRYYLGDAGYVNSAIVLAPYRGVRYHLKEWERGNKKPQNAKELFNLRHASLRNVIERIFGVTKRKFKILSHPEFPSFDKQVDLIFALTGLWNFIYLHEGDSSLINDDILRGYEDDVQDQPSVADHEAVRPTASSIAMDQRRDRIADELWEQYQGYLASNRGYGNRIS